MWTDDGRPLTLSALSQDLLEARWDHALRLATDQMKKQRDEQVALAVSKFDVEQRLKFQAEISKGLERVEAAARAEGAARGRAKKKKGKKGKKGEGGEPN
jgi:hypothetical protein